VVLVVNAFDITKDIEFKSSNDMFTSMLKLTQREGKINVMHKEEIEPGDIDKMYSSLAFNRHSFWPFKQSLV
jgi:hypothetical protein